MGRSAVFRAAQTLPSILTNEGICWCFLVTGRSVASCVMHDVRPSVHLGARSHSGTRVLSFTQECMTQRGKKSDEAHQSGLTDVK